MICTLFIIVAIMTFATTNGFRLLPVAKSRYFTMTATETDKVAQFEMIQQKINDGLSAKVAAGKAPAAFVDIVKGFVAEYATSFIEGTEREYNIVNI